MSNSFQFRCIGCGALHQSALADFRCYCLRRPAGDFVFGLEQDFRRSQTRRLEVALEAAASLCRTGGPERCLAVPRTAAAAQLGPRTRDPARGQHAALFAATFVKGDWRLISVRETSGHEPNRIIQRRRHDRGCILRPPIGSALGCMRVHRKYLGVHGGVRSPWWHAQSCAGSRRQDFLEQALAGPRLRSAHLPVAN